MNKQIAALLIAIFVESIGWGVVYPVFTPLLIDNATHLLPIASSIAMRNFWFALVIAVYCVFMFLASPVLGSLSDRYGRKAILLLSLLGNALGFAICAWGVAINTLWLILVGRIIAGACAGSFPIAQAALMDISEASQKTARLGWLVVVNGVGFACGPIIGGIMLDKRLWQTMHYEVPFWSTVMVALLGAYLIYTYFTESFQGNKEQKIDLLVGVRNMMDAFKDQTRTYCLVLLLFMTSWSAFFTELSVFLDERFNINGAGVGYFMTYLCAIFVIGLIVLLPKALRVLNLSQLVFGSLIVQFICQILFALSHHYGWLWLIIVPLVIGVPFAYVGLVTQVSNLTDTEHQGRIMGVVGSVIAFSWGAGPLITGMLAKINFIDPYYASVAILFLAIIVAGIKTRPTVEAGQ